MPQHHEKILTTPKVCAYNLLKRFLFLQVSTLGMLYSPTDIIYMLNETTMGAKLKNDIDDFRATTPKRGTTPTTPQQICKLPDVQTILVPHMICTWPFDSLDDRTETSSCRV